MLPKRQVKQQGPAEVPPGPPKYQPPPQVSKSAPGGPVAPVAVDKILQQPQVKAKQERPASTGPEPEIIRPVSPSRGPLRPPPVERPAWRPLSDEELLHRPPQEVLRIVRAAEAEIGRLQSDHNQWLQDARSRLQAGANELRAAQVSSILLI
jgi:hypothetical protein